MAPFYGSAALASDGLPTDVAPKKPIRPMNTLDRLVVSGLRDPYASTSRADVEHAPSICHNVAAPHLSSSVENFDPLDGGSRIEPLDHGSLGITAGISLRRHHNR